MVQSMQTIDLPASSTLIANWYMLVICVAACMHACIKWVWALHQTLVRVYIKSEMGLRSITFKPWQSITYLGCWYVMCVLVQKP